MSGQPSTKQEQFARLLLGTLDAVYAIAHHLADHEARLDILVDKVASLEFQLGELNRKEAP